MTIVKATLNNVDDAYDLIEEAKVYFKNVSIPQWQLGYPNKEDVEEDIKLERLYLLLEENEIVGIFSLVYPDHNYDYIEDGKWFDNSPYIAIHRMVVKEKYKGRGYATKIFNYVKENYDHIRVDTHILNESMKRAITKNDFKYCGVIYVKDGSKRNAYEWIRSKPDVISNMNGGYKVNQTATNSY